jgi:hypothetical protein
MQPPGASAPRGWFGETGLARAGGGAARAGVVLAFGANCVDKVGFGPIVTL